MEQPERQSEDLAWNLADAVRDTERLLAGLSRSAFKGETQLLPPMSELEIAAHEEALLSRLGIGTSDATSLEIQIPHLDDDTRREIEKEIDSGRILSQRSSTALAVNFFQPWRSRAGELGKQLGAPWVRGMRFEAKYATELSDKPIRSASGALVDRSPTPDVVLEGGDLPTIAIEAKFTEPYFKRPPNKFAASYFQTDTEWYRKRTDRLWTGLPTLHSLALALDNRQVTYQFLHAAQLIKHALGLAREYGRNGFWLNYVWFDGADQVSRAHRREIEHFLMIASNDIHVGAISYQDLNSILGSAAQRSRSEYVAERYFNSIETVKDPERNQVLPAFARPRRVTDKDLVAEGRLSDSFSRLSPITLIAEVRSLVEQAPRRHDRKRPYFEKNHDRTVSEPSKKPLETHLQRAMTGKVLRFVDSPSVRLLDYEIPMKASGKDHSLGKADLFGVEEDGRHVVIELKVLRFDRTYDSPLRALLEGLTYSAVLASNRATVNQELREDKREFKLNIKWEEAPSDLRLIIAAPSDYWGEMNKESGWLRAADRVIQTIASGVGVTIQFVNLGSVGVIEYDNGPDNDGRVRPLLAVDGIHEDTQIQASILASWTPTGERSANRLAKDRPL